MNLNLTLTESRVIGVLLEKEITTPEQYPLSLNALTNGCNQKSNRDPVMSLTESEVQNTVDELVKRHLVTEKTGFGSRVPKYHHRFANTEFSELQFNENELGIICVLFLRGPQTPGELRSRTNRLCKFADVSEVEMSLEALIDRNDGPFVKKFPREPGRRESRYGHLLSHNHQEDNQQLTSVQMAVVESPPLSSEVATEKIQELEARLDSLSDEVTYLRQQLDQLLK